MISKIEKLKEEMREYTHNEILAEIDIEKLKVIIQHSECNEFLKQKVKEIEVALENAGLSHSSQWKDIYSSYAEAIIFIEIGSKVVLKRRNERAKESKQTSDFIIEYNNLIIFAEFKALLRAGGDLNYIEMTRRGLDNAVFVEEERNSGKHIIMTELVHQPFKKNERSYDPRSIAQKAEILIDKLDQNFKDGQYGDGHTITIIDISQLYQTDDFKHSIVPAYFDEQHKCVVSGFIWYSMFGSVGNQIFKPALDGFGSSNIDNELTKEGFLKKHPEIPAVLIRTTDLSGKSHYAAIINKKCPSEIQECIYKLTNQYNDFRNEGFYLLYYINK